MQKDQKVYAKENDVYFRKQSEASDGAEKMKTGEELTVVDGPWWRVAKSGVQGWVRADYLSEISPIPAPTSSSTSFVIGIPHPAEHLVTLEVRKNINDEFGGGVNKWSLQCTEYAMHRLRVKIGILIQWPVERPRHGGRWADIFERNKLYEILQEPQPDCAVCFTEVRRKDGTLTEEGHVAFVEEVLPDSSIKISEANWPRDGIYNERVIPKADWQNKYKARFVKFV